MFFFFSFLRLVPPVLTQATATLPPNATSSQAMMKGLLIRSLNLYFWKFNNIFVKCVNNFSTVVCAERRKDSVAHVHPLFFFNKCVWLQILRIEMGSNLKTSGRCLQVFSLVFKIKSVATDFG